MVYSILNSNGVAVCRSCLPYLGYSLSTLREMERAGYTLTVDGKKAKFPNSALFKEAQHG